MLVSRWVVGVAEISKVGVVVDTTWVDVEVITAVDVVVDAEVDSGLEEDDLELEEEGSVLEEEDSVQEEGDLEEGDAE